jgi:hypothetical protein
MFSWTRGCGGSRVATGTELMFKPLCIALALAVVSAATIAAPLEAASFRTPGVTDDSPVSLVAAKKKKTKKSRVRRCKKGRVYSKRRGKCVAMKKRIKTRMKAAARKSR